MKKWVVFIWGLFVILNAFAQAEATDTVTVSGRISKIEALQKDWNSGNGVSGEKNYQIYWLEFTLPTAGMTGMPATGAARLPANLVFASPSSGLWSELEAYRHCKVKDTVSITFKRKYLEQFISMEKDCILINKISLK
jgi:hypothetical protein